MKKLGLLRVATCYTCKRQFTSQRGFESHVDSLVHFPVPQEYATASTAAGAVVAATASTAKGAVVAATASTADGAVVTATVGSKGNTKFLLS